MADAGGVLVSFDVRKLSDALATIDRPELCGIMCFSCGYDIPLGWTPHVYGGVGKVLRARITFTSVVSLSFGN
jgi:hypothetical protein